MTTVTISWPDGTASVWSSGIGIEGEGPLTDRQLGETVGLLAAAGVLIPVGLGAPPTRFRASVSKDQALAGLRAAQAFIDRQVLG